MAVRNIAVEGRSFLVSRLGAKWLVRILDTEKETEVHAVFDTLETLQDGLKKLIDKWLT